MSGQIETESPLAPIHPFPARMASEIALEAMSDLQPSSIVVDPMCGSGVVLREAIQRGHSAFGIDVDPLAVLMSRVWTCPLDASKIIEKGETVIEKARSLQNSDVFLPWIDEDNETKQFINFWFAERQRDDLRRIAFLIANRHDSINRVLQLAMSRLIITKKIGASLAWDVSHSRPHRVRSDNDYDVLVGFRSAVSSIAHKVGQVPTDGGATIRIGNAKHLSGISDECADLVLTSPPYLNAIDYIRGHRLSLVWLGYRVARLRRIRSLAVGSEKGLSERSLKSSALKSLALPKNLDASVESRLRKYVVDMTSIMREIYRIVKPEGRVVLVVASSNIRGEKIDNPALIGSIARSLGLSVVKHVEREIADNRRYLPPPSVTSQVSLRKRMHAESILTLKRRRTTQ